jgi:hypothetical protein
MASLKAFLPNVARAFGTTPDALYSRQRALIRLGLLPVLEGKGPGSGVLLTADTLAVLIIAILTADTLAETDQRVVALCEARDDTLLRETGIPHAPTFRSAVAQAITDGGMTELYTLVSLEVSRCSRAAIKMVRTKGPAMGTSTTNTYLVPGDMQVARSSPIITTATIETKEILPLFFDFAVAAGLSAPTQRYP